ncbi:hypothetical protein CPLU01_14752, partial [Colletotrichum plurivorum]
MGDKSAIPAQGGTGIGGEPLDDRQPKDLTTTQSHQSKTRARPEQDQNDHTKILS